MKKSKTIRTNEVKTSINQWNNHSTQGNSSNSPGLSSARGNSLLKN